MKAKWVIDKASLQRWSDFKDANIDHQMVKDRQSRNVERNNIVLSKKKLWRSFVVCQITTLQKSGPNTPVSRFLNSKSSALYYDDLCTQNVSVKELLEDELSKAGLRFPIKIASNLSQILELLKKDEWTILLNHLKKLKLNPIQSQEQLVVEYLQSNYSIEERQGLGLEKVRKKYPGLGPKQARNFIQMIGLSRYEVPLDSRVLKKLKELGCSFVPGSSALSDESVYRFLQSGIQQIAEALDVHPCILDACIFSSFNKKKP